MLQPRHDRDLRRAARPRRKLAALELDAEIPEDLYIAVAEAIAWAYSLDLQSR